jgi:SPP1 gp7 family putative phage head morphogenesis protein
MKNKEYFNEANINSMLASERSVVEYTEKLKEILEEAERQVEKELNTFYAKYEVNGKVTYSAYRRYLTSDELTSMKKSVRYLLNNSEKLNLSANFVTYLESLLNRTHVARREQLLLDIRTHLEDVYQYQLQQLPELMEDNYIFSYYNTAFIFAKGMESAVRFNTVDMDAVDVAIRTKWNKANYSDSIWADKERLIQALDTKIPQAFTRGLNGNEVGAEIAREIGVSYNRGITVARTNINYIANQATLNIYKGSKITKYEYLATLDMRTSEICRSLDGQVFAVSEAQVNINYPPMHPNCRSTTVPYIGEPKEYAKRIAKDENGKNILVPRNMTQEQWIKKYAPEDQQERLLKFIEKYSK